MPERETRIEFSGTVVRIEADGFGIIKFDHPIGPSSNTLGFFSSSTSSALPFDDLRPGAHVIGMAEADERDIAAIKQLVVTSRST